MSTAFTGVHIMYVNIVLSYSIGVLLKVIWTWWWQVIIANVVEQDLVGVLRHCELLGAVRGLREEERGRVR